MSRMPQFDKMANLEAVYKGLDALTAFLRPALTFLNSHLTEFYTQNYWETLLPPGLRADLESQSVPEVKQCVRDLVNGSWRNYDQSLGQSVTYETAGSFKELIAACAKLQLSELRLSKPVKGLRCSDILVYKDGEVPGEGVLKLDKIMSAKKTHEVEVMSDFIKKISDSVASPGLNFLVDVGSGKGYLSSYLSLSHNFNILAVDSSSTNTKGCERRSEKMEKAWAQLVRRAVERKLYGQCSKRGKHWKSKKRMTALPDSNSNDAFSANGENKTNTESLQGTTSVTRESGSALTGASSPSSPPSLNSEQDNKLLKTLTQFVTPNFDLTTSLAEQFPSFMPSEHKFGLVGLHTCGNLGVASLKLYISNEKAKFLCNIPCCYHLLDERHEFYPSRRFYGSKKPPLEDRVWDNNEITNVMLDCAPEPTFPISRKLGDVNDSSRFCLGRNARMMSAYSLPRMAAEEKGLEIHPSLFHRSVLQVLIKRALGDAYLAIDGNEQAVGKIGDKCKSFTDYVRLGLKNMGLETVQPSDNEIGEILSSHAGKERERLEKYYLVRSIFASVVEGVLLLDRLAFLLEQENVAEAHIVELFDPAVSPRYNAILSVKY